MGIGKTLTGTIIEAKGSLNSKSPFTVKADWWGFLRVCKPELECGVSVVFHVKLQPVTYPGRWSELTTGLWTVHSSSQCSHYIQENLCCTNVELQEQMSCNASSQINGARLIEVRWKQTWMNPEGSVEKCLVWIDKFYFQ